MRTLFWLGLVVLMLGGLSLFVPIPRNERKGVSAGGIAIGIETQRSETVLPLVSGVIILAGAGMMIAGKRKS
jgi:hypothetical protein